MKHLIVLFFAFLINQQALAYAPTKGKIIGSTYVYNKIGWSFNIPNDWSVRSAEEIARVRGIAKEAFLETLKQDVPLTPTPLIYLHNNKNRFTSDAEVYTDSPDKYESTQDQMYMQIQALYKSKGFKYSANKNKTKIDGMDFIVYETNILSPDGKKVLVTSAMFTALINNIDFIMSYTCMDRDECKKIKSSVINSKFSK